MRPSRAGNGGAGRWVRRGTLLLAVALVGLNLAAFGHAYALTHFVADGPRTPPPDALSLTEKIRVLAAGARVPHPRNRRTPADLGLAFERRTFDGAGGVPLEAWWVPASKPRGTVVLFHGHADVKASLLAAAAAFHDLGFDALLVDFHGSGGSGGDTTSIGYHEAEDVTAAFRHASGLSRGRPVVLYGVSMGAAAILRAAAKPGLRPAALILESPFDSLLGTVRHRFTHMGVPAFPAAYLLVFWGGVQQGFNGLAFRPGEDARRVSVPTLLMSGDRDPTVTVDEARGIFDHLAGPKDLKWFAGLQHQSFLKARPQEWNQAVAAFLARCPGVAGDRVP